jgi:hypothetical protein
MSMIRPEYLLVFSLVLLVSCQEREAEQSYDSGPDKIFPDYAIQADEGSGRVTCRFRFRAGGPNGKILALDSPARIELDGQVLQPDSAGLNGVYYEVDTTVTAFAGKHSVVFTGPDKKQYREDFEFHPLGLARELPDTIDRKPFRLQLTGMPVRESPVRLVMTDTAFESDWVNELTGVVKGEVDITVPMLRSLKPGPITLEIYREEDHALMKAPKRGGRMSLLYSLKREFVLRNQQIK